MIGLVAAILSVVPVAPAAPATTAAPMTTQAIFDAASTAVDSGKCGEAVRQFEALEARPAGRSAAVAPVIALRKGRCLGAIGRVDDAQAALTTGLATIGEDPLYVADRVLALIARGQIAYLRFDYAAAARDFSAARSLAAPADRLDALIWLVRTLMFDPGDDARTYADEALALATAPGVKKSVAADVHTLHARVLINHGDVKAGYAELRKALDEQGGLTLTVNASAISTRSDLAIAALLNHDDEEARRFLTYTGAGHGTPFGHATVMAPPPCDDTIKPDDSAIVEFGIGDDGAVRYATPVYASRLGPSAVEFAKAVAGWSWTPEALTKIAPLFRAVTRVELRCSTASAQPKVTTTLRADLNAWLQSRGVAPVTSDARDAAQVASLRAELARRRAAGGDGVALVPVLFALGNDAVLPAAERHAAFDEAHAIAARTGAPPGATTLLAITASASIVYDTTKLAVQRDPLRALLATPAVAADPHSRSVVRLLLAAEAYHVPPAPDAEALLRAVADDSALPDHDPLRTNARVRLASLLARNGDLPGARAAFDRSGVTAQQCALVDARPALANAAVRERDFPQDALRWGFDGWVKLEFDVAADGSIAGQRAIVAYPPRIFDPSAIRATRNWRYEQSFRPDGVSGCGGAQQTINFHIATR